MARLKSSRMTDSTLVSSVDDNISDLEAALSAILGIPLDTEITQSVLGFVQTDGSINGLIRFSGPATNAVAAQGIEIASESDGGAIFRIVAVNRQLIVYEWDLDEAPDVWSVVQVLNNPIKSLEDLNEFAGLSLSEHDGKILKIDATDPDDVYMVPITAIEAGSLAFPDLTDVQNDFYTQAAVGDLVKVNDAKDGLTFITPDVVASDVQRIGQLTDVREDPIVADWRGRNLEIEWDPDGADQYMVRYTRRMVAAAAFNYDIAGGNYFNVPSGVGGPNGAGWKALVWNILPDLSGGHGDPAIGQTDGIFLNGQSLITLPEVGAYIITASVTWRWNWYNVEQGGFQDADTARGNRQHRLKATDNPTRSDQSITFGGQVPNELWTQEIAHGAEEPFTNVALREISGRVHHYNHTGIIWVHEPDAHFAFEVQQNDGVDRAVKYCLLTIVKL